jgi:NAD(P)-dependent dehydrogenase (short-subunit alcohol dehydrogenase family)
VNNASIFEPSSLLSLDVENLDRHFGVNFKAPFILTGIFAKLCGKGHIINILDTHITQNRTSHLAYLLSKKSLYDLTKLSAVSLAPQIRVNAVAPGLILPPVGKRSDHLDRLAQQVPLKRKGDVAHVVQSLRFLVENDYMTGQVLFADGGEHLL